MPIEIGPGIVIGAGITITNIDELYTFSSFTFTNATATGRSGPSLANCLSAYNTSTNPWLTDTSYFNVTSGIQYWTVPKTGSYTITAAGAQGGTSTSPTLRPTIGGAVITGTFSLTRGEIIRILVGQQGAAANNFYGSGGGGSFVIRTPYNDTGSILAIAGGGAGINYRTGSPTYLTTAPGQAGNAPGNIAGTEASNGGGGGASLTNGSNAANGQNQASGGWGGGGGGFVGNGGNSGGGATGPFGGSSWTNGGSGGLAVSPAADGGFGGGGGAGAGAGAGGGGYNGGTAGDNATFGGGGGSYNSGTSQTNTAGANVGQGYVTITAV